MTEELDRLAAIMRRFADDELQGSSPLYERLARAAVADPTLLDPLLAAPKSQRRATLYFAAIHSLVLGGQGDDLAAFFPDIAESPSRDDPVPALRTFLKERRDDLEALYATRNTQTNEVGRCAFLLPMFGLIAARARRPLAMIEAGASAGLTFCSIATATTTDRPARSATVASRIGIDLQPVDVGDVDAIAWLRACIWPEHIARLELFERAVEEARRDPPEIVRGAILETLPRYISAVPEDTPVCVFHTATLAYMNRDERARFGALMAEAGSGRDVYWVAGEGPHILAGLFPEAGITGPDNGYALVVAHAGRDAAWVGESAYHGRWLRWRP